MATKKKTTTKKKASPKKEATKKATKPTVSSFSLKSLRDQDKTMKDFANFIAEDKDPNEYDNEGEMAKSQLRTVVDAAEDLMNLLDDEDNLPEWAQGKITKAVDYLDSVRDYMTSEAQDDLDEQFQLAFKDVQFQAIHKHRRTSIR